MSNILEQASLVLIPSGYKSGKLYSQIPIDGDGDLQFTRASNATRVNSAGLIEKVRTNVVLYSQDFSNANWLVGSVTKTTGQSDPNGGTTGVLITSTNTSGAYFYQTTTGAGCMSVYAKAGTRTNFSIINGLFNNGAGFNLSTQTVTVAGAGSLAKIESVGGGWYRCSVYVSSSTEMIISLSDVSGGGMTIGDTMSFAFAQVETGDIATDYIPTTTAAVSVGMTADVPRLDYSQGSCPSLLLEPQRTNLLLRSEEFDNVYWSKGSGSSVVADQDIAPDGTLTADRVDSPVASGIRLDRTLTCTPDTVYTFSFYCKNIDKTSINYRIDTTAGGTIIPTTNYISQINTSTYTRIIVTFTTPPINTDLRVFIDSASSAGSFFVWGAQIEEGSYPTSYIPTLGTSVTRVADATGNKDITSFAIGNSYTVLFDLNLPTSEQNRVFYQFNTSTNSSSFTVRNFAGGLRAFNNIDAAYPLAQYTSSNGKYIIRVDGTSYNLFYLNAGVATKRSATLTTARNFGNFLFDGSASALNLDQHLIFKGALTDAQCNDLIS
jgi:hypothetical protein